MSRAFDKWYHSKGEKLQEELETFFNSIPDSVSLEEDLGIHDLEEFIDNKVQDDYESFMGDIKDQKFEEYKERDI